jgi:hypothetical protein
VSPEAPTYSHYLCSYRPLTESTAGREAIRIHRLPPFIDGSCRREPDFEARVPSISALCRGRNFAPRLCPGDRIAYISRKGKYAGGSGWCLVALLTVEQRFKSHQEAAKWYAAQGYDLPSNCMVPGNQPQTFDRTNQNPPVNGEQDPTRVVCLWDAAYARRARRYSVFLACRADFLELWHPPVLRHADMISVFHRVPGTQYPITPSAISQSGDDANASDQDLNRSDQAR